MIDVAEHPWGPWVEVERIAHTGRQDESPKNSYHPVILPWSSPAAGLVILISENAQGWPEALERIDLYRPTVVATDWPFPDDLILSERSARRDG